jgi:NADH-quinone oxidoreductase subunit J
LFTKYLLPFEVTSVLLLAAIVGAIVLAGKKE